MCRLNVAWLMLCVAAWSGGGGGDGMYEVLVPTAPGQVFVAGQMGGGELGPHADTLFETYTAGAFGMPRYVDVEAGQIVDVTADPLVFTPVEE